MSNPMQMPKDYITSGASKSLPRAFLPADAKQTLREHAIKFNDVNAVKRELRPLRMEMAHTVITSGEFSCDKRILEASQKGKPAVITAPAVTVNVRLRSTIAEKVLKKMYDVLPQEEQERVGVKMLETVKASGGTQAFFGRLKKYFPKRLDNMPIHPPTKEEVGLALENCGLRVDRVEKARRVILPIETEGDELGITIAKRANLGAPVFAKPSKNDEALPNAIQIAYGLEDVLTEAYQRDKVNGVAEAIANLIESQPDMMVYTAKCKEDFYKIGNVMSASMRMYLNAPAGPKLFMSQVTQAVEEYAKNCITDNRTKTAQRLGLAHGNADKLIAALTAQLQRQKDEPVAVAYLHCGDDAVVVAKIGNMFHIFGLDESAFDITQQGPVRAPVIEALEGQLATFCPIRAQTWACMSMTRLITVSGAATYLTDDGGTSGGHLQSEVNDMLSDVFIQRLEKAIKAQGELDEESLGTLVENAGRSLGFVVKLENYHEVAAKSFLEALSVRPVKFLSFYLVPHFNRVCPVFDPERLFARLPYPGTYTADKDQFELEEAVRIASVLLGCGAPFKTSLFLAPYNRAYAVGCQAAVELLQAAHDRGLVPSKDLMKAAFQGNVYVGVKEGDESASLAGLANALRNRAHIWLEPLETGVSFRVIRGDVDDEAYERPLIAPLIFGVKLEGSWADDFPDVDDLPEEGDLPRKGKAQRQVASAAVKIVPRPRAKVTGSSHGRIPAGTVSKEKKAVAAPSRIVPRAAKAKAPKRSMASFLRSREEEEYDDIDDLAEVVETRIQEEIDQFEDRVEEDIEAHRARVGSYIEDDGAVDDESVLSDEDQVALQTRWENMTQIPGYSSYQSGL